MAMTKKEAADMETLKRQLAEAVALRFSSEPAPVRMPLPTKGYVNGWNVNSYGNGKIFEAWTERYSHGSGHRADDGTKYLPDLGASQNATPLFKTKLEALIALRMHQEQECARLLAATDFQIAAEREAVAAQVAA